MTRTNGGPRKLIACFAALGVVGLAWLPSEHIHSRVENGQHSEYVHRHFEPHHPVGAGAKVDHDDEDDAQYLSSAFTTAKPAPRVYPGNQFVVLASPILQAPLVSWPHASSLFVSVHDPPWTDSLALRAPPAFSV